MNVEFHVSIVTMNIAHAHNHLLFILYMLRMSIFLQRGWSDGGKNVVHQNNSVVIRERELLLHVTYTPANGNILLEFFFPFIIGAKHFAGKFN